MLGMGKKPRGKLRNYPSDVSDEEHIAVDTLGHLLALKVTPANEQERAQVGFLPRAVQAVNFI